MDLSIYVAVGVPMSSLIREEIKEKECFDEHDARGNKTGKQICVKNRFIKLNDGKNIEYDTFIELMTEHEFQREFDFKKIGCFALDNQKPDSLSNTFIGKRLDISEHSFQELDLSLIQAEKAEIEEFLQNKFLTPKLSAEVYILQH